MNKDRLEILKSILSEVDKKTFNIGVWAEVHPCGKSACAVGHAILSDLLPELGGAVEYRSENSDAYYLHPKFTAQTGLELVGWGAVRAFFDLGPSGSRFVFERESYCPIIHPTPQDVIGHINKIVNSVNY